MRRRVGTSPIGYKEGTKWVEEESRGGQNHRQVRRRQELLSLFLWGSRLFGKTKPEAHQSKSLDVPL